MRRFVREHGIADDVPDGKDAGFIRTSLGVHFHEAAREFFLRGNGGVYGSPTERAAGDTEVHHFVDSTYGSATSYFYFDYNKGELQYTYLLFEPVTP